MPHDKLLLEYAKLIPQKLVFEIEISDKKSVIFEAAYDFLYEV